MKRLRRYNWFAEERNDEETNNLLESIRNDLVALMDDKTDIKLEPSVKFKSSKNHSDDFLSGASGDASNANVHSEKLSAKAASLKLGDRWMEPNCFITVDKDLHNMQVNLKESHKLFQTMGERFETINFESLQSRIRNLNFNENGSKSIKFVNELNNCHDRRCMKNRRNDLTKFRKESTEFRNIPELTEFFGACDELQHGLERLKNDRLSLQNTPGELSSPPLNKDDDMFKENICLCKFKTHFK